MAVTIEKLKIMSTSQIEAHISGIYTWLMGFKNGEPGYYWDAFEEYNNLSNEAGNRDDLSLEAKAKLLYLGEDILKAKELAKSPVRNSEEERFYKHIVGVNSYIREQKQRDPFYNFDNVTEAMGLLDRLEGLKTADTDILSTMYRIFDGVIKTVKKTKPESAEAIQRQLKQLNVRSYDEVYGEGTEYHHGVGLLNPQDIFGAKDKLKIKK